MTTRTARLFQAATAPEQGTGDIISFEAHDSEMSLEDNVALSQETLTALIALEQQADTLDNVVSSLSGIALSLESSLPSGGAYPRTMFYANLAIEQQLSRIDESMEVISQENVGGALTRVEATQQASSALGEKIKSLWERIVGALKAAWEHIVKFFRGLFTATGQLRKRAQRLLDEAHGITVVDKVGENLDIGMLLRKLTIEGKVHYNFAESLEDLTKLTHDLAQRSLAWGKEQAAALSALLAQQGQALYERNQMYHIHVGKFTPPPSFTKYSDFADHAYHRGSHVGYKAHYVSPIFPGERTVHITVPTDVDLGNAAHYSKHPEQWAADMHFALGNIYVYVDRNIDRRVDEPFTIPMPSLSDIEATAKATIESVDMFDKFKHEAETVQRKAEADLRAVTANVARTYGAQMFGPQLPIYATLLTAYGRVARQLLTPSTIICALTLTIANDFVKVAEKALNEYRTEKQAA